MPVLSTVVPTQETVTPPTWLGRLRWSRTSASDAVEAERNLLRFCTSDQLPLPTSCQLSSHRSPLHVANTLVGERNKDHFVHSISGGNASAQPIVCLQGYGAGAAIYYRHLSLGCVTGLSSVCLMNRNMDFLCRHFQMHCVDWIGTGLSGRPAFTAKNTEETEDFFIEALKAWYDKQGLGKIILMGHSLGGYLAALYAKRHPEDVKHLILVSPAAVSGKPENYETPAVVQSRWSWQGQLYRGFKFLFASGVTPQMLIRTMGPWGRDVVGGYVRRRFQEGIGVAEAESASLQSYFYHISAAKPSGEHALRHIFHPIAWGKEPLDGRLSDLKVPISFIYGESDWMDPRSAKKVCGMLEEKRGPKMNAADRAISVIPCAGHFVFLDQPELFNGELLELCRESL